MKAFPLIPQPSWHGRRPLPGPDPALFAARASPMSGPPTCRVAYPLKVKLYDGSWTTVSGITPDE
jgi:hypothetical protein